MRILETQRRLGGSRRPTSIGLVDLNRRTNRQPSAMPGDARPQRSRLNHAPPPWVSEGSLFFITINCSPKGTNQLCLPDIAPRVLDAARFYHHELKWHCRLMLLMPDHLHALIAVPTSPGLKTTITRWKGYVAKTLGVRWQQDFFDHRLRDHWQVEEKTSYILNNPLRRGLCRNPFRLAARLPLHGPPTLTQWGRAKAPAEPPLIPVGRVTPCAPPCGLRTTRKFLAGSSQRSEAR